MNRMLIWDLPTRVLHWAMAGTISAALILGLAFDDEHPLFAYHMLFGLIAGGLVAVRLVLGVIGSRHARFSSWTWSPAALGRYAAGVIRGNAARSAGHNPGSSWINGAMLGLVGLLVATGLGGRGAAEAIHEVAAFGMIALIGLHLAGLVLHTLRHRENIARSMIDGRKIAPAEAAIPSAHPFAGLALAAAALAGSILVFRGYDPAAGVVRLPLIDAPVNLPAENDGADHAGEPGEDEDDD